MSAHSRGLGVISKWSMDSPETVVSLSFDYRVAIPVLSKIFLVLFLVWLQVLIFDLDLYSQLIEALLCFKRDCSSTSTI